MINTETGVCCICEGEFYKVKMREGKCDLCARLYPGAKSMDEVKEQQKTQQEQANKDSFDNRVERKIWDVLEQLGVLSNCDCGNKFFKKSPAQKSCGKCINPVAVKEEME